MAEMTAYDPGTLCWADLATTDTQAATAFYTEVFGWTAMEIPTGDAGTYSILSKNGKTVAALYRMPEAQQHQKVPPYWASYISVANVDESAERAWSLGGTVLQAPFDVMDVGRMVVIRDPTGAVLSLWEPKSHRGAELMNEPGALCWTELQTTDLEAAGRFYSGLFGWNLRDFEGEMPMRYVLFLCRERAVGGMLQIQPEWGEVPPNWMVYFAVADLETTLERAQALDGKLVLPPMKVPGEGRIAVLQDPQGGYFAVLHPECQTA